MSGGASSGRATSGYPAAVAEADDSSSPESSVSAAVAAAVQPPAVVVVFSSFEGGAARVVEVGQRTVPQAAEDSPEPSAEGGDEGEDEAGTSGSSGSTGKKSSFLTPGCERGIAGVVEDLMRLNEEKERERVEREEEERRGREEARLAALARVGAWVGELVAESAGVGPQEYQASALRGNFIDASGHSRSLSLTSEAHQRAFNMEPRETRRQLVGDIKAATARRVPLRVHPRNPGQLLALWSLGHP
ncbi:hypothetical protein B0T21DRAFT_406077 [Apiosordaria backusii]|uniref:Uncharacterized protein n=1 Tax=Apiosordaria backusii TaxID=314023 RepID=A0AA40K673_9PEZI|nr:hypothetical protein B0T21DRAFT_406077 [Apiosordaria backusii]